MAKQVIGIGSVANDGTGDTIRAAFDKCNDNFTELYTDDAGDVNSITATAPIERDSATGAVTISLADAGVTLAKMQNVAANSILGRNANSSGVMTEIALATTQILIGDGTGFTAASLSGDATMTNAGAVTIANDAVTHDKLENRYTESVSITTYTGSVSFDWSAGCIFVMGSGLTGSFTINMSNYKKGQVITIHALTGSETVTLDTATGSGQVYNKVGGVDYDGSTNNQIQIECIDDDATPIFNYQVGTYTSDATPS
jgi:hypothetical protein